MPTKERTPETPGFSSGLTSEQALHDHDGSCTCGHDHTEKHTHDHSHGESCSCGHDHVERHAHDHSHGDDCTCGHDHNGHNHAGHNHGAGGHDDGAVCECCQHAGESDDDELRTELFRVLGGAVLYVVALLLPYASLFGEEAASVARAVGFLIPYAVLGYGVIWKALKNISRGKIFDENFLMCVATIGALALGDFPEAVAVMLFYQIGELFEDFAVGRSKRSITELMDIRPDHANVERDGSLVEVDPDEVRVGDVVVVKPGERVPLDGDVIDGVTQLDTAALTGESVPLDLGPGDQVISGSVNLTGVIRIRVMKEFGESTVSRILDLVQNASEKKSRSEAFITRFARYYTPIVCGAALLLAIVPPLVLAQSFADWGYRALTFLVVSCPCALVVSVPLSFFGGIGGASRKGILVKGSNYLEALAHMDAAVFDKTGTLTRGVFEVVAVHPRSVSEHDVLEYAAYAESFSTHPIAQSVRKAYGAEPDASRLTDVTEVAGRGVTAKLEGRTIAVGNDLLMTDCGVQGEPCELTGTILHVSVDGEYMGHIVISDVMKEDSPEAIAGLKKLGVSRTVMLTGDREEVAAAVARQTGVDEYRAQLLPADKVDALEQVMALSATEDGKRTVAFVGDGINDAPVLMRADVGIAMGAIGSDAAIEAADVVLMDDHPSRLVTAMCIARKTMSIVYQNIVFAIGVKLVILALAAVGIANMWAAVFGDVGVLVICILNAMRAMRVRE